ncbi:rRNA maturation RNase YbeY [Bacteroidota bacterium]
MNNKPSVYFFSEGINYTIPHKKIIREWIYNCIQAESKKQGNINLIFCNDNYLHKLNLEYLNHNTLTDIITFNNSEGDIINADIFISHERAAENAKKFRLKKSTEIYRLIIHGILHLIGYNDKVAEEKQSMSAKEDYYLSLLPINLS